MVNNKLSARNWSKPELSGVVLGDRIYKPPSMMNNGSFMRNLSKADLGGVIFGCTHDTMRECLVDQLFGLPGQHISYVQNIEPGLPLFLFNYSDRKLYGIFEAESQGQLNINPYGWNSNGSERTKYPAQVRVHTRLQCEPLSEKQFKPIIVRNYQTASRFCFEIDKAQASALISLFGSSPVIGRSAKWIPNMAPNRDAPLKLKPLTPSISEADPSCSDQFKKNLGVLSDTCYPSEQKPSSDILSVQEEEENEEHNIYLMLKQLALEGKDAPSSSMDFEADNPVPCNTYTKQLQYVNGQDGPSSSAIKSGETSMSDLHLTRYQLTQGTEDVKAFSQEQCQTASLMAKKMAELELENQHLKERIQFLESQLGLPTTYADEIPTKIFDLNHLIGDELIFLLGGLDGNSLLSTLDCYSLSKDVLRPLQGMSTARSHAAAAVLNGQIYIFGGGYGGSWQDSVESYNPISDEWTSCPSMSVERGNLTGDTLHGKLFAIGGGNGENCFSDVEMFDPSLGRWIHTQSMLQKRFSPASAVLNGALYVVGGYDGEEYLNSAERFDPRAISWGSLPNMNTRRGCHSLVAFNEKLYAFGGFDGTGTVSSMEVLDPRYGSWTNSDSMIESRGYAGAVVIGETICVIGGVQNGPNIVNTVEYYKEGQGWSLINSVAVGKRCFFSAVVL